MRLDALTLRALVLELAVDLRQATLQKLLQLTEADYLLQWRRPGQTLELLICLRVEETRLHLVTGERPGGQVPSAFTMLMRKHLLGKRLESVAQIDLERAVRFTFSGAWQLVAELQGTDNNLVLIGPEGRILGAHAITTRRGREMRPGRPYQEPPRPTPSADSLTGADLLDRLGSEPLGQALPAAAFGLSRSQAARLLRAASLDPDRPLQGQDGARLARAWNELMGSLQPGQLRPGLTSQGRLTFQAGPSDQAFPTMQAAAQAAWEDSTQAPGLDREREQLQRKLHQLRERAHRRQEHLRQDLEKARSHAQLQHQADVLLAHLHEVRAGQTTVTLPDWESPEPVLIELQAALTPSENAQAMYTRARKLKRGVKSIQTQLERVGHELAFLEENALASEGAQDTPELDEIRASLNQLGARPARPNKGGKPAQPRARGPRHYRLQGFDILVGRNPIQNEQLSLRVAARGDLWLHAREVPGAHVLVKAAGRDIGPDVVVGAAVLAARHSRAHGEHKVIVTYTQAHKVRKPPGAPPGRVTIREEETVVVDPQAAVPGLETVEP